MEELLNEDYVNEDHIQAFSNALHADEGPDTFLKDSPHAPSSPVLSPRTGLHSGHGSTRVRKVSALSDFAPVNMRVKRRTGKGRRTHSDKRRDWLFLLVRWPLLFFIFLFIAAEFGFYILIRQLVNTKEYIFAWTGRKGVLRKKMRAAKTYQEWREVANQLDEHLHFDDWKKVDEDPFYDWMLVRKVQRSLRTLREAKDARGCLGVLETCMRSNFAGVESPRLYSETYWGTKDLIESYVDEQEKALEFIRESPDLSVDEKKRFFKSSNTNLGISALCLSGGGSFGYYHFGVVKAFLDAGLLPRVITGTSAGGLIAALTCTRTDEELKALLVPEIAHKITACEEPFKVWFKRFRQTGARFDSVLWARKCNFFTRGSMTFKEAYLRTGRILNISVIPADRHSPTKLLNYVTAPDTVIWSALLASAAVPGILNPVVLMQKLKDGSVVPWNWGSRFKDGSLRVDIPVQALNLYFNVTHPVVSQVNPHVHLFFFAPRGSAGKPVVHSKGKGWRGNFLLSAAEQWLKHELTKNFKVIRDLELLPQLLGQDWSSVFLQRFDGAVTIWPRTTLRDWIHILSDPDPPELERMIKVGQLVTWPKLHMISNRARLERQILLGRKAVRRSLQAKPGRTLQASGVLTTEAPPPTGSDYPLSVDSDAENAFHDGNRWFFRRGHPGRERSGHQSHGDKNSNDPLQSATIRRKWTHDLLEEDEPAPPTLRHTQSRSILSRMQSRSFIGSSSRIINRDNGSNERDSGVDVSEQMWSSDSSFDDDLSVDERRSSRQSPIPPMDADEQQTYFVESG